ncbi:MAG: 2-C-methyl-D-erythritol 4-phosphate cytidylyltransferase [Spirochaetaceae bacterium]|jgi:2-C-methyl-D-erythritol 4-phosphate cytidylyltransferase|nr:2-C-methyl-D-erythritol 4-phosphate cytidylyltransferase [Spirochaetaceae bacterium]
MIPRIAVIITAAGLSLRMGGGKKEYLPLPGRFDGAGKPLSVLGASLLVFAALRGVETIVITHPPGGEAALREALPAPEGAGVILVPGGESRRASVQRALEALASPQVALIHDGARPWVDGELALRVAGAALEHGAAIPLLPLSETPKEHDGAGLITGHLRRGRVGLAQTPQGFLWPGILEAHRKAERREREEGFEYTDDAEVWAEFMGPVAVVPGSARNRKITFPGDLEAGPEVPPCSA